MLSKECLRTILYSSLIIFGTLLFAQQESSYFKRIKELYESLEFEGVVSEGNRLLRINPSLPPEALITLHQYIALSYYSLGKIDSAQTHFLSLLSIKPGYELDPVSVSPKIIAFFNRLKKDFPAKNLGSKSLVYTRYVFLKDLRPGAAWRSALIPGWGQLYKHQKGKGFVLGGAFWSSLIATAVSLYLEDQAHQKYLDSRNPTEIDNRYETYNRWFKTRKFLTYTTLSLWAVAVTDALLTSYTSPPLARTHPMISLLTVNIPLK